MVYLALKSIYLGADFMQLFKTEFLGNDSN